MFAIFSELGWPWSLMSLLKVIPSSLRDLAYDQFAKYRYRMFGKRELNNLCLMLPPDQRSLILDEAPTDPKINQSLSS